MALYTNHTHMAAIVTIQVDNAEDPGSAFEIGHDTFFEKAPASPGIHDYVVDAGKQIRTANNTVAKFIAVRSAT